MGSRKKDMNGPLFNATIDLKDYEEDELIAVFAVVEADQSWEFIDRPQSHLVNARTDPLWYYENKYTNKYIQGRRQFFSIPLTIKIGSRKSIIKEQSLRNKYFKTMHREEVIEEITRDTLDVLGFVLGLFCIGFGVYGINQRLRSGKSIVESEFHEEYPMNAVDDIKDKWVFFE